MFRTLHKEATVHLLISGAMVLAIGVTGFYFQFPGTSHVPQLLVGALLLPITVVHFLIGDTIGGLIMQNPTAMFLFLWGCYSAVAIWLTPWLLIRQHSAEDLKRWYIEKTMNR